MGRCANSKPKSESTNLLEQFEHEVEGAQKTIRRRGLTYPTQFIPQSIPPTVGNFLATKLRSGSGQKSQLDGATGPPITFRL